MATDLWDLLTDMNDLRAAAREEVRLRIQAEKERDEARGALHITWMDGHDCGESDAHTECCDANPVNAGVNPCPGNPHPTTPQRSGEGE